MAALYSPIYSVINCLRMQNALIILSYDSTETIALFYTYYGNTALGC